MCAIDGSGCQNTTACVIYEFRIATLTLELIGKIDGSGICHILLINKVDCSASSSEIWMLL